MYNKFFRRHSNLFLLLGTALVLAARNRVTQPPDSPTSSPALTTSPILAAPPPTPDLSSLITRKIMKEMKPIYTKDIIRVNLFVGAVIASLVLAACSPEPTPIAIPETPTPTLALPTDTIAPTEPPTQVPTIPPTPIPTAEPSCPDPTEGTQLLRNEAMGYCLLFPADYIRVDPLPYEVCLVPGEPYLLCHNAVAFFNVEDAAGRSLSQVADENNARYGIIDEPSSQTIAGEEAILFPEVAGQATARVVIAVHDDRLYSLVF